MARWFGSSTQRLFPFHDMRFVNSAFYPNYAQYVSDQFDDPYYENGRTSTYSALLKVRTEDLPEARNLGIEKTFVAVFTDGASNSEERDNFYNEIDLLKKEATILSIGLGSNYNPHELKLMSSDGTYSTIADFSKVDEIMQDLMFKTCTDYDCSKLFEVASEYLLDDEKFPTMGTSYSLIKDFNSYNEDDSEILCPKNCAIHKPDADNPGSLLQKIDDVRCESDCTSEYIRKTDSFIPVDVIKDTILEASRDRINPAIVLAIIISNIDPGFFHNPYHEEGYVCCTNGDPSVQKSKACWGLMAIPVQYIDDLDALKAEGPGSVADVKAGIDHLERMLKCVCEGTSRDKKHSIPDMLDIVRRGIAAFRVGCENAKAPHIGDINDQYGDWDYSNDVISKAKYYAKTVFN